MKITKRDAIGILFVIVSGIVGWIIGGEVWKLKHQSEVIICPKCKKETCTATYCCIYCAYWFPRKTKQFLFDEYETLDYDKIEEDRLQYKNSIIVEENATK